MLAPRPLALPVPPALASLAHPAAGRTGVRLHLSAEALLAASIDEDLEEEEEDPEDDADDLEEEEEDEDDYENDDDEEVEEDDVIIEDDEDDDEDEDDIEIEDDDSDSVKKLLVQSPAGRDRLRSASRGPMSNRFFPSRGVHPPQ
jgi:hypothetical protein